MVLGTTIHYKLSEEIVRWRFELKLRESREWWIAFTNPTAGPWKRLMGRNRLGQEGEVYRFPRDNDRPDVVAVNDTRRLLLIVEAKDTAPKLTAPEQVQKSSEVVRNLAGVLSDQSANPFWAERVGYKVIVGLLWGRSAESAEFDTRLLFQLHEKALRGLPLIGFETTQQPDGALSLVERYHPERRTEYSPLLT